MIYPIPKNALDDRFAIVGTAGSGKTYLALGAIEHLLARHSRIIGIDPLGVMFGLRLCADGVTPSPFNVVIFGGPHGDLPINERAGALIGEAVATMRESCIVDLSQIGTKAGERRFMLAFLTALYKHTDKSPVHLIIDEADMWAPQRLMDKDGDAARLLGMMETVVRRGRIKGFIPWLITQRPAVLSKDVLSQADGIVALKLTASQDRDAIGGWIEGQGDRAQGKALLASLPSMKRGQGALWIPSRGILDTVTFPPKTTFDSSRTPERGEKRAAAELKPLDLSALKTKLATVEAETKANDPIALRSEIGKLKSEIGKLSRATPTADPAAIESARADGYERGRAHERAHSIDKFTKPMQELIANGQFTLKKMQDLFIGPFEPVDFDKHLKAPAPRIPAPSRISHSVSSVSNGHDTLTSPQRRIMASLAFWKSIGHETPTREQVAAVAGYRPGSGNFNNLIGGLSTLGHTSVAAPGRLQMNVDYPELSPADARDKLWSVFDGPQKRLVQAALEAATELSRDDLAANAGYAPGSGNFNNIAGSLSSMDVLQKPSVGKLALSDWAREVLQ